MRNHRLRKIIFVCILFISCLLNLLAWFSKSFSDAYIRYVFPVWVSTYGRLTGLAPFSVGEILLGLGLLLLVLAVFVLPIYLLVRFLFFSYKKKKQQADFPKKQSRFVVFFYRFFAWVCNFVFLIMTLNCVLLYHGSTFAAIYFPNAQQRYSVVQLAELWNQTAAQCNRLSLLVERDEEGYVIYATKDARAIATESSHVEAQVQRDTKEVLEELEETAVQSMRNLSATYPLLSGYLPHPKALLSSDFMCQQYMCGYYFPFSMEANYNKVMYLPNIPSTLCHELAHLKGFIMEDEANFIAYLACVESEDLFFQYSGYLNVLGYIGREFDKLKPEEWDYLEAQGIELETVTKQVALDNRFVLPREWERIEKKAILDTEVVDQAADVFVETSLKANGVTDGMKSYGRVVQLLLAYYDN